MHASARCGLRGKQAPLLMTYGDTFPRTSSAPNMLRPVISRTESSTAYDLRNVPNTHATLMLAANAFGKPVLPRQRSTGRMCRSRLDTPARASCTHGASQVRNVSSAPQRMAPVTLWQTAPEMLFPPPTVQQPRTPDVGEGRWSSVTRLPKARCPPLDSFLVPFQGSGGTPVRLQQVQRGNPALREALRVNASRKAFTSSALDREQATLKRSRSAAAVLPTTRPFSALALGDPLQDALQDALISKVALEKQLHELLQVRVNSSSFAESPQRPWSPGPGGTEDGESFTLRDARKAAAALAMEEVAVQATRVVQLQRACRAMRTPSSCLARWSKDSLG